MPILNQEGQVATTVEPSVNVEPVKEVEVPAGQVDVSAEIEKAKAEIRAELEVKFKSEISGLNKKNTELRTSLNEKELEGKSEAEKLELIRKEKQKVENEIVELNRGRLVDRELDNAGLPLDFAKRIIGTNEEEIKEDIKNFGEYVGKIAQEKADKIINSRLGGKPPVAGVSPSKETLDEQIKKAQGAGNFTLVMALKEQKRKQQTE